MNKVRVVSTKDLHISNERFYLKDKLFTGFAELQKGGEIKNRFQILDGVMRGSIIEFCVNGGVCLIGSYNDLRHGYFFEIFTYGSLFTVFDMEVILESVKVSSNGNRLEYYNILNDEKELNQWFEKRIDFEKEGYYKGGFDILPFYKVQNELKGRIIKKKEFSKEVKYIGGVDVAYNEQEQRMMGAIVVLDAQTLDIVEKTWHEMEISFPYIPGLFSFREIPPIIEAYKKLKTKPDLIVCDGHGIAHPKGVGMATHLGIELNIPTIGCAKKRLVGFYDKEKLGTSRGNKQSLIWDSQEVGVALRTQLDVKPVFVSIGHKIDLETSINWILKLCTKYRLPETTRQADQVVNRLMKERTEIDMFGDDEINHPV